MKTWMAFWLKAFLRGAPGVFGPALVAIGAGMIYLPAGLIVAGLALWILDVLHS